MRNTSYVILLLLLPTVLTGCSEEQSREPSEIERAISHGTLVGTIIDGDTGEPVPARVYAIGSNDSLYMAEKCLPYEQLRFGSRIGYTGRHFTTIGNTFTVKLPEGSATIIIERGKEYIPVEEKLTISSGKIIKKEFVIRRWLNMAAEGWYSGDLHVHRPLKDLADLMLVEDLNVACPQTVWGQRQEPDLESWLDKADDSGVITVDNRHMFSVLSQEIERFRNSAVLFHHTGKTILPVAEYDERGLTNISLIEHARDAGGYVEAEKPWWPESHIDIAVGKADFTGIVNNHMIYGSYLPEHPRKRTEFRDDYPDGVKGYVDYVLDLYYAYLNCGFRVMPSAGSASGVLPNPLGYNRVYVKVDGAFTYDNWFAALKNGRCFATNGPMLIMTVDGKETGDTVTINNGKAHVVCEIHSLKPIDRLEIIRDGENVYTVSPVELSDNKKVIEADIPVSESGWLTARCFEKIEDNVRFAHTAPVFIEVEGKPFAPGRYAVEYFLRKTKELIVRAETGEFPSDEARNAAMGAYQNAKALFENLLEKSR